MKQRYALPPLLFNFVVECAIRKVHGPRLAVDMIGMHKVLAYAYVNLIGDDISTIERNTDVLFNACLSEIAGKTKYMEIRHHRSMTENQYINIDINSYQTLKTFKYSGSSVTNQDSDYVGVE